MAKPKTVTRRLLKLDLRFTFTHPKPVRAGSKDSDFSLALNDTWSGELHLLTGPSGSGKTTFLNLIAGVLPPTEGELYLNGKCLFSTQNNFFSPPSKRQIAYVFQEDLLFPHMTVRKNIYYGCRGVEPLLASLEPLAISELLNRYPHQLSGGERRRIAIARALMRNPKLLLLDEPFTGLNADLRIALRDTLLTICTAQEIAMIVVTHDHLELLSSHAPQHHHLDSGKLRRC